MQFVDFDNDNTDYSISLTRDYPINGQLRRHTLKPKRAHAQVIDYWHQKNGSDVFGLAATFAEGPIKITAGVSYGKLGDQDVPAPAGPLLDGTDVTFCDASVVGFGIRLGYTF